MAEQGLERELKLGISSADDLEALIRAAGGRRAAPALQINHFFDTPEGVLRRNAIGLRVREEGGHHILTVKGPTGTKADGVLSERVELEFTVASERGVAAIEGRLPVLALLDDLGERSQGEMRLANKVLDVCGGTTPAHIGSFTNRRIRVDTELAGTRVILEFDRTQFREDECRFEVELELGPGQSAEPLTKALRALFEQAGTKPVATSSKLARFLEVLGERD